MDRARLQLPEGMQDDLPGRLRCLRQQENRFRALFERYGYREVDTPLLEFMEVFAHETGNLRQEQLVKSFDHKGRILVVRPEMTAPVVRMVASRLRGEPLPLRLCYVAGGIGYDFNGVRGLRQYAQAGVECLGAPGPEADAEMIALAAELMQEAGLRNFQLELGQVEFFKGIMEEAGLTDREAEEVRRLVEEKNMLAIELMLKGTASRSVTNRLMQLTMLYGGREVIEEARKISRHPRCVAALENVTAILDTLRAWGLVETVCLDLGMVHDINYYTGMIFRGILPGVGAPVLTGGRYDSLAGQFGYDIPATGFAADMRSLLAAAEPGDGGDPLDLVVGWEPGAAGAAFAYMQRRRAEGLRVESWLTGEEGLRERAAYRGARACLIRANGEEVLQ